MRNPGSYLGTTHWAAAGSASQTSTNVEFGGVSFLDDGSRNSSQDGYAVCDGCRGGGHAHGQHGGKSEDVELHCK